MTMRRGVAEKIEMILAHVPLRERIIILEAMIEATRLRIAAQEAKWMERAQRELQ